MSRMPHSDQPRHPTGQLDPDPKEVILGVDTHKDVHVAAVIDTLGAELADATFPTTAAGYRRLLAWARSFGVLDRAGVEGTGALGRHRQSGSWSQRLRVTIFDQPDAAAVRDQYGRVVEAVQARFPDAATHLDEAREDLLTED